MNRRNFLIKSSLIGSAAAFSIIPFTSCENGNKKTIEEKSKANDPCLDLSGISKEEIQIRESYKYVGNSPHSEQNCKNCEFWIEPEANNPCGGCDLFEGPVNPNGFCDVWSKLES